MTTIKKRNRNVLSRLSPFTHTFLEKSLWRGWFRNGQSLEFTWNKYGWDFGINYTYLDNEDDHLEDRLLFLYFYKLTIVIPLGFKVRNDVKELNDKRKELYLRDKAINRYLNTSKIITSVEIKECKKELSDINNDLDRLRKESIELDKKYENEKYPEYELRISKEFGIAICFYKWNKSFRLPWNWHHIDRELYLKDGTWMSTKKIDKYNDPDNLIYEETHPYKYDLNNGEMQERTATITLERTLLTYSIFKYKLFRKLKFLSWTKKSIDVKFSDEVGEGIHNWKGGCVGCGYDLLKNETMEQCLRRMEVNRKF